MSAHKHEHNQAKRMKFLKVIPGGNPTILVDGPDFQPKERLQVAVRLMHPLHLQAEQVGFIKPRQNPPRLDMMGGEFCLNATRALAFEATRQNRFLPLADTADLYGLVSCSGHPAPLQVRVPEGKRLLSLSRQEQAPIFELDAYVTLECGVGPQDIEEVAPGAVLVRLPGISHLLLDENRYPQTQSQPDPLAARVEEAAVWRGKLHLNNEAACGVVWYKAFQPDVDKDGLKTLYYRITPLVHVAETKTAVLESACGSASLALSLLSAVHEQPPKGLRLQIFQPSNEGLHIYLAPLPGQPQRYQAEVGGPVWLCAEGEAYI